jgi:hypothetical protein
VRWPRSHRASQRGVSRALTTTTSRPPSGTSMMTKRHSPPRGPSAGGGGGRASTAACGSGRGQVGGRGPRPRQGLPRLARHLRHRRGRRARPPRRRCQAQLPRLGLRHQDARRPAPRRCQQGDAVRARGAPRRRRRGCQSCRVDRREGGRQLRQRPAGLLVAGHILLISTTTAPHVLLISTTTPTDQRNGPSSSAAP